MIVALTALVVALGGSALAAEGGFQNSAGTIQGCVATENLVNGVTDTLNQATAGALAGATNVVTPKGALIVVAPGSSCPPGTTPQQIAASVAAALPQVVASAGAPAVALGKTNSVVAALALPAPGNYLVNAFASINASGDFPVDEILACVLVNGGKVVPSTEIDVSIPPTNTTNSRLTVPISVLARNMIAGKLAVDCKVVLADYSPTAKAAKPKQTRGYGFTGFPPSVAIGGVSVQDCKARGNKVVYYASGEPNYCFDAARDLRVPAYDDQASGQIDATPTG